MTFTEAQQREHRKAFINECRQKAWGALCHAEWISKNLDDLLAFYQKFQAEDTELATSIKEAETAIDYHTVENRTKRKTMQERRNKLAQDRARPAIARTDSSKRRDESIARHPCRGVELEGGSPNGRSGASIRSFGPNCRLQPIEHPGLWLPQKHDS